MAKKPPPFADIGKKTDSIEVQLSYRIVELFSEGLYASPNKAIEELVANSFDAGARKVQVLLSPSLHDQDATIVVIDDGEGMDAAGLKQHWLIGNSNKRKIKKLPKGRQQIGKFGIGKLATYVLAKRLTHISKYKGKFYSTSMDYTAIDSHAIKDLGPKKPIKIALRVLTEAQAKQAASLWIKTAAFKAAKMPLFGTGAPASWTLTAMSDLKPKVHEIQLGTLEWILRTALPLRPDFSIFFNGKKLVPSKKGKGLIKTWVLGKDLITLPKPSPKNIKKSEDKSAAVKSEKRFGLSVPGLGRITGYVEVYKDLLTGKSDAIGRSNGFFIYVFGRLVNVFDGHFGISPEELRHGTFGRFRAVINIDSLDAELRSNREAISEGPLLNTAQDVLRSIFNAVRSVIEKYDKDEEPGAVLARRIAESPGSLSRGPIMELARSVMNHQVATRYLYVPEYKTKADQEAFLGTLEQRLTNAESFITGLTIDYNNSPEAGIARYDTVTGKLQINAWHPFIAAFYEEYISKNSGQPLELLAMAEVLAEAHMHALEIKKEQINDFLTMRDQLLRNLANDSGKQGAFAVALALKNARNNPDKLEERVCDAFKSLGFEVIPMGKSGRPDGVAVANLSADHLGNPQHYRVSLDAKSKKEDKGKVAAGTVKIATIVHHRDKYDCQHALVIGRAFSTTKGDESSIVQQIDDDRKKTAALGNPKTITLINIDDLAELVRLRQTKQLGLRRLRGLFDCRSPEDSAAWISKIKQTKIKKLPYKQIVTTIDALQKKYKKSAIKYPMLMNELTHLSPPITYETDEELIELCKTMAQLAPGEVFVTSQTVELDQSPENVMLTLDAAMKDDPTDED